MEICLYLRWKFGNKAVMVNFANPCRLVSGVMFFGRWSCVRTGIAANRWAGSVAVGGRIVGVAAAAQLNFGMMWWTVNVLEWDGRRMAVERIMVGRRKVAGLRFAVNDLVLMMDGRIGGRPYGGHRNDEQWHTALHLFLR